jgi:Domain of unknown function (DUF4384)
MNMHAIRDLLLTVVLLWLSAGVSWSAAPLEVTGEYKYGPEISDAQACRLAVLVAKNNALQQAVGEDLSIDQSYACVEKSHDAGALVQQEICALNKYLWSQIRGEIQSMKVLNTRITTNDGSKSCHADISVRVVQHPPVDSAFDFAVGINGKTFRLGETLKITVTSDQVGHLSVFSWTPEVGSDGEVLKIFPNLYQSSGALNTRLTIPNQDYDIAVAGPPSNAKTGQVLVSLEHLIFVMSRSELRWPEQMSYDEFSKRIFQIDPKEVRIRKKTLSVVVN